MTTLPSHWLIPQGAEFQAVARGLRQSSNIPQLVPIPLGAEPVGSWLAQIENAAGVLLMGVGGSLTPKLGVGDVVLHSQIRTLQGIGYDADALVLQHLRSCLPQSVTATALYSDRLITQAEEKQYLGLSSGCEVVEMESAIVAQVLRERGIPWVMLRVISDDVHRNIPPLDRALRSDGSINGLALAASFLQQPIDAYHFIRGSLKALSCLGQTAEHLGSIT